MRLWESNGDSLDSGRLIEIYETQADCSGIMRQIEIAGNS